MRRILVFGAAGFIGSHVVRHARESGLGVVAVSRAACDLLDPRAVDEAFAAARPDAVLQLAGTCAATGGSEHYPLHTLGALNVMESAARLAPEAALLFFGSAAEYGEPEAAQLPCAESCPARPKTFYGAAKFAQITAVSVGAANWALKTAVVRPFNVIGPGLPSHYFLGALAEQLAASRAEGLGRAVPVYNAAATRDYLDVRDAAGAILLLARHIFGSAPGVELFNLCSGRETSIWSAATRLAGLLGGGPLRDAGPGSGRSGVLRSVGDPGKLHAATGWLPSIGWERSVDDIAISRGLCGRVD